MNRSKERYWLHALLFVATFVTTTAVGARLQDDFRQNRALYVEDFLFGAITAMSEPASLATGLPFSLTLLAILAAHEMGHYLTCRYYSIDASLPYFLPAPTIIGTLGAFIRIRTAIFSKQQLFDVGVAGPIAGFVFLLPALGIGLAYSKVIPGIGDQGDLVYSTPLLLRMCEALIFPGVAPGDLYLHPVARAAWVGLLATALNLLPMGQLDGGHILYSFVGDWHKLVTRFFVVALIPLGLFYSWTWLLWAAVIFFFASRHPRIYDTTPLGRGRTLLGLLCLAIFIVSFSAAPVDPRLQHPASGAVAMESIGR
jgi:membrane-associated protease RseP (regulator of RpoE activity)